MQRTAVILACLFITCNCYSQLGPSGGQYPYVHYTPKDGLISSRIRKAYQDSRGLMYFLTAGGLSVYDGARFRNYTTQQGLPFDIVNDVLEVGEDSLLVATNTGALNAIVKGKIVSIKTEGDHCPIINEFYRFDEQKIYLACDDGLFLLENKKLSRLDISSMPKMGIDPPYLANITRAGNYLLFTTHELRSRRGLYLYDIKNNRLCDMIQDPGLYMFGKDRNNRVWLSNSEKLFVVNNDALLRGKLLLDQPGGGFTQSKDYSSVIAAFDTNIVWLVYRENSKNREIRGMEESGNILRIPLPEQALNSDIRTIFVDREKNIWICNDGEGLFKIINSSLQIFKSPFDEQVKGYINYGYCADGVTWLKFSSNRLMRSSHGDLKIFTTNLRESPLVFYEKGTELLARDNMNIYKGRLHHNGAIFFEKIISLDPPDFFPGAIKADRNGFIIAATSTALMVWQNRKLVLQISMEKNDFVPALEFDQNNLLWIVKRHNGIQVCSLQPGDPAHYLKTVNYFAPSKFTGSPRSFTIDKRGWIWIGTRSHGLLCYEPRNGQLYERYHFNVNNGLTENFITALSCDSANNIIVGTQTGLDRLLYQEAGGYRIENLSKSADFFALIYQAWSDEKKSYALTNSGVLFEMSPIKARKATMVPQLLLEEVRVNAKSVNGSPKTFGYRENNLSFHVAAPSFIDEKQIRYSYLLGGSGNKQWSDTAASNSVINLSNLSAGIYLLKMKAFFPSGIYPPAELSYHFEITPPWWQTWWFRVLSGLLIIGLLIIASRFYYRRKLEKQMAALEKKQAIEQERTRIATDMHDDLGAGLSRIKFLSETIGIKKQQQEPIEEDINKIREYSHEMIDKMGEIVWALNEKNDSISDLLSYSRSYAVEYLSQSGIECDIKVPETFPAVMVSGEFRRNIYLVLKEALHNIVKHAQAGNVKIRIDVDRNLVIIIKDDGIGFDRNNLRPFSNGLGNMEKRMKDIGGDIQIKTEKVRLPDGQGTVIILTAPLGS